MEQLPFPLEYSKMIRDQAEHDLAMKTLEVFAQRYMHEPRFRRAWSRMNDREKIGLVNWANYLVNRQYLTTPVTLEPSILLKRAL